jgi:hypothetical protein
MIIRINQGGILNIFSSVSHCVEHRYQIGLVTFPCSQLAFTVYMRQKTSILSHQHYRHAARQTGCDQSSPTAFIDQHPLIDPNPDISHIHHSFACFSAATQIKMKTASKPTRNIFNPSR